MQQYFFDGGGTGRFKLLLNSSFHGGMVNLDLTTNPLRLADFFIAMEGPEMSTILDACPTVCYICHAPSPMEKSP